MTRYEAVQVLRVAVLNRDERRAVDTLVEKIEELEDVVQDLHSRLSRYEKERDE